MDKKKVVKSTKKIEVKTQEEKNNKKKTITLLFCLLSASALIGTSVVIYGCGNAKPTAQALDVFCETSGVTLSNDKATKGKNYTTEISISEEKISQGYTLPLSLTKVVSGNRTLKSDVDPKEYTYILKEENKKADFKILGEFVEGDITIELTLVPPKAKHNVYWYNYDGTLLEEDIGVEEGTVPTYDGDDPTNYGDEKTKKTWSGWDHEPEAITTGDQEYHATFSDTSVTPGAFFIGAIFSTEADLEIADPITLNITYTGEAPTIDWGDGATSVCPNNSHTYTKIGQYGIRVNGDNVTNISLTTGSKGAIPYYAREVYFGGSIISIPKSMFTRCNKLAKVRFDENNSSLKTIGEDSFSMCSSLKTINIPNSVETIKGGAFNASGLEELTFSDNSNLVSIENYAFKNSLLKVVNIPKNVNNDAQTLGTEVFQTCNQLTNIYIPSTVETVGKNLAYGSEKLEYIFCGATSKPTNWDSDWDKADYRDHEFKSFWNYAYCGEDSNGFDYAVTNDNKASIFRYKGDSIDELVIPNNVETDKEVTIILNGAFRKNDFSAIKLPTNLIEIGESAFKESTRLESISIPSSTTTIGGSAFMECTNLATINFGQESNLETIGESAFQNVNISSINLPNKLKTIGRSSFTACWQLTKIVIPGSVQTINDFAFTGCSLLNEVDLTAFDAPPTLGKVGSRSQAFDGCDAELKLIVKDSATKALFVAASGWEDYAEHIVAQG